MKMYRAPAPDSCACLQGIDPAVAPIVNLGAIRSKCSALKVILHDDIWPDFERWHGVPDAVALHHSTVLLAALRGHLRRVTSPVHGFLLADENVRPNVARQYLKDLREHWMFYDNPEERHQHWRMFHGRLAELQFAAWLACEGWNITGLEALGGGADVEAVNAEDRSTAFEVKYIGTDVEDFNAIVKSIAGEPAAYVSSAYSGVNYLLFRVFEAAKQLARSTASNKIAVVVIDAFGWSSGFKMKLDGNWIDWTKPQFIGPEPERDEFLLRQTKKYPGSCLSSGGKV